MRQIKEGPIARIVALIMNERVQAEVGITRPQLMGIKEAFTGLRDRARERLKEMQRLPDAEKPKAQPGLLKAILEDVDETLAKVLRPDQLGRFQQLRLQHEGLFAFKGEKVCGQLSLTPQQLSDLHREAMHQGPGTQATKQDMDKILGVLNEEQGKRWKTMLGKPFDFGVSKRQETNVPSHSAPDHNTGQPLGSGRNRSEPIRPAGDPFADDNVF
jgi:hypothetical protein